MNAKSKWSAIDADGNAYCQGIWAKTENEARELAEEELKVKSNAQLRFWIRDGKLMRED